MKTYTTISITILTMYNAILENLYRNKIISTVINTVESLDTKERRVQHTIALQNRQCH